MHEMAITERVVAAVSERIGSEHAVRVVLEIGQLSGVVPDALRFCFEICAKETPLEGALLEIREIAGRAHCGVCGADIALDFPVGTCACGSPELAIVSGRELRIKEVEVAA
jgi:hydrogenase nickel incorporation protein HypA/HybF